MSHSRSQPQQDIGMKKRHEGRGTGSRFSRRLVVSQIVKDKVLVLDTLAKQTRRTWTPTGKGVAGRLRHFAIERSNDPTCSKPFRQELRRRLTTKAFGSSLPRHVVSTLNIALTPLNGSRESVFRCQVATTRRRRGCEASCQKDLPSVRRRQVLCLLY